MIDWAKYWICDAASVNRIFENEELNFLEAHSTKTGLIYEYPKTAKWKCWEFEIKSHSFLEVSGSLHKHWNKGSNENDFTLRDLYSAIVDFCRFLKVSPYDMTVHNLEFGVNIVPDINASVIMRDIVCYKNRMAKNPIDNENGYFMEFETDEYYLKIYDKGLQAQEVWEMKAGNILRVEVKATNSGFLQFANILSMADLLDPNKLKLLGNRLDRIFKEVVFDDCAIKPNELKKVDSKVYQLLVNPRVWADCRKRKTTTIRAREHRFKEIVAKYGKMQHNSNLSKLVEKKWHQLLSHTTQTKQDIEKYLQSYRL